MTSPGALRSLGVHLATFPPIRKICHGGAQFPAPSSEAVQLLAHSESESCDQALRARESQTKGRNGDEGT